MKNKILETMFMRFVRYILDWRDTRAIIRELNKLNDRELRDIGLDRSDINSLIYTRKHKLQRGRKN
jgi:uncharacterized protein YjiS (DUF1127 family)